ncbi:hypothetical protein BDA96_03G118600 [Sorghum bicolor]|jgi:hypothetical protein|uniref:Secreted protein n=2 Tax=Sorghum bicolor TaxID=4558 RepID=A0A1B6Q2P3_SORBI|nr:hypothetical protein BDA96_03G118600 [Sorghum bicolor]KXG32180.1 hypothetical protein SORBI_3003G114000 [Sorghum bicolor]OQU86610.1 hypothetical protein SORBI_3003G114000 [Sorghum bicolor]
MASLLLFLRAIVVSANDEAAKEETTTHEQRPEKWTFGSTTRRPATARCDDGGTGTGTEEEEEERWLVSCLEWPRVDRKSAWMQIV